MKKIVASVGLVALGTSGLYSAPIPGLTEEGGKNWSVSATLRGFYDDNINTTSGSDKQDTFGIEISPSVAIGFQWPQTTLSLAYVFSFKYYDHRPIDSSTKYDQSHIFNASVDHAFTERYHLSAVEQQIYESAWRQCLRCEAPACEFCAASAADLARAAGHLVTPVFVGAGVGTQ